MDHSDGHELPSQNPRKQPGEGRRGPPPSKDEKVGLALQLSPRKHSHPAGTGPHLARLARNRDVSGADPMPRHRAMDANGARAVSTQLIHVNARLPIVAKRTLLQKLMRQECFKKLWPEIERLAERK